MVRGACERFNGHKLKVKGPGPDGKYVGTCSCGGWTGFNQSKDRLLTAWNKQHVNKFDKWR